MSVHPNSGTFLPPAVRFAKIIGTVGSGALAESNAPAEKLVRTFKHIHHASRTPALATIIASSSSLAYVAYYLFYYPPAAIGVTTTTFDSDSFIPSTSREYPLGEQWALYGASALLVALVVPYTKVAMRTVQRSLLAAADSVETTEQSGAGLRVVDGKRVMGDLEEWQRRSTVRVGLAGAAAIIAIVGLAT